MGEKGLGNNRKLGKLPRILDKRTLHLENYVDMSKLPPLPDTVDYLTKAGKFSMAGNSDYGDCVVAGAAHMVQVWTATAGRHIDTIPDKTVIDTYFKLTGGVDSGLYLLEFLKFWKNTGFGGHKIGAFLAVNPKNWKAVCYANFLFGGTYIGLNLPVSAQSQTVWDVPEGGLTGDGTPGSWGGHCVDLGYATHYVGKCVTWGAVQPMTDNFLAAYCDEMYAIVTLEWFGVDHKTPQGILWKDLLADLSVVSKLP